MVSPGDALAHRTHEEDRSFIASASRTDPQLFPGSENALQRCRRRPEQQSQSDDEKIVWLSHLPRTRTGTLSLTWQVARARIHPRIFLTNQKKRNKRESVSRVSRVGF